MEFKERIEVLRSDRKCVASGISEAAGAMIVGEVLNATGWKNTSSVRSVA